MSNGLSKVKIALLGCGGMMGAHAQRLRDHPDVEIVGLCDVSEDRIQAFQAKNLPAIANVPRHFTDPAEMYEKAKPDAVVVSTPHTQHFGQGVQALAARCHVFMEKPMVTALADAYALEQEVRKSGKIFVIGYNTSCSPEFHYLREIIRNGSLGRLELVTGFLSQDWMRGTAGLWRQEPAHSGGGQAYDSGAHLFNSLCWSVEKDVEEVFSFVDNHGTKVDINSVSSIRFAGGVMANITVSGNSPGGGRFMAFIFDGGRIEIDGWGGTWCSSCILSVLEQEVFGFVMPVPIGRLMKLGIRIDPTRLMRHNRPVAVVRESPKHTCRICDWDKNHHR